MGTLWRDFATPRKLLCDEESLTDTYGKFIAEPFERGYGMKIGGVLHEFSAIPGVLEDITQVVMNVKQLVLRSHSRQPKLITIEKDKKGAVTAGDLQVDETIERSEEHTSE